MLRGMIGVLISVSMGVLLARAGALPMGPKSQNALEVMGTSKEANVKATDSCGDDSWQGKNPKSLLPTQCLDKKYCGVCEACMCRFDQEAADTDKFWCNSTDGGQTGRCEERSCKVEKNGLRPWSIWWGKCVFPEGV